MTLAEAIAGIEEVNYDPSVGLPDDLFYFISKTTPLVNVDLLIKDEQGRTLLAWRNDQYAGCGWHIPGGIVRFKESFEERIQKVAETELGCAVSYNAEPLAINQLIHKERDVRGHFISLLYSCHLPASYIPQNAGRSQGDAGFLQWHEGCPSDLIVYHKIYQDYI